MESGLVNTHNKSIEWDYLPDQQLASVVSNYPFYTKANLEVFKRIQKGNSSDFDNLKDRTLFYLQIPQLFHTKTHIKNKISDNIDDDLVMNDLNYEKSVDNMLLEGLLNPEIVKTSLPVEEPIISVEPLHTVDYFLSQGIKITDDTVSNDKLGTQLKSFTDWLKSMKKVHTQRMSLQSETTDKIIQTIAEHSNEATVIETEAMAEVLISQGKRLQALEIYQKLSLKNPSESAYFAAKIQSLKQA